MIEADLYSRSNISQRRDAKEIIKEFAPRIHWSLNGRDTLLDIGCGTGDVTVDFVVPIMPKDYERIVGGDLSTEMIEYAKRRYAAMPRLEFRTMDVGKDALCKQIRERFHHVTSFYCLHWVQNQKRAAKNIYDLLLPGGDCLLVFLARNPIFDVYRRMASNPRWAPYMKDADRFVSPYQDIENPHKLLKQHLTDAGFEQIHCETRDRVFVFDGIDILSESVRAVDPFKSRIPIHQHNEYFHDYFEIVRKMGFVGKTDKNNNEFKEDDSLDGDIKIYSPYTLLIAHARKSSQIIK
ncbi:juvenile hormone acid O-methyltransferase-like [Ctenocephalides felis]|uniref:juvenile hormone acid O-methyltransferase-like n=2 Tax=Ctenocephalides felis TaxID=7515 RepID=UPI000E6E13BE|nr:juvenile hormone acid O-methyltransferase-like [Ctenocephalides felis]